MDGQNVAAAQFVAGKERIYEWQALAQLPDCFFGAEAENAMFHLHELVLNGRSKHGVANQIGVAYAMLFERLGVERTVAAGKKLFHALNIAVVGFCSEDAVSAYELQLSGCRMAKRLGTGGAELQAQVPQQGKGGVVSVNRHRSSIGPAIANRAPNGYQRGGSNSPFGRCGVALLPESVQRVFRLAPHGAIPDSPKSRHRGVPRSLKAIEHASVVPKDLRRNGNGDLPCIMQLTTTVPLERLQPHTNHSSGGYPPLLVVRVRERSEQLW